MITFINAKQAIIRTNYWDSDHAKAGLLYLSWNAGAWLGAALPDRPVRWRAADLADVTCEVVVGKLLSW